MERSPTDPTSRPFRLRLVPQALVARIAADVVIAPHQMGATMSAPVLAASASSTGHRRKRRRR